MNKLKKNKANGITLIALVVTIIVLLLLAGISIQMLTGDNGILQRATDAKTKNDEAQIKERIQLAYTGALTGEKGTLTQESLEAELTQEFGEKDTAYTIQSKNTEWIVTVKGSSAQADVTVTIKKPSNLVIPSNLTSEEQTAIATQNGKDANDQIVEVATADIQDNDLKDTSKIKAVLKGETTGSHEIPIPVGATYITGTENTGVVISYKNSEFVWVPVPIAISDTETNGTTNKAMAINAGTAESPKYRGLLYDFNSSTQTSSVMQDCTKETNFSASDGTGGGNVFREIDILSSPYGGDWDTNANKGYALIRANVTEMAGKENDYIKANWLNQLQGEYNLMVASVEKYGGFFVGRYETSYNGTQVASRLSTESETIMPMTDETTSGNTWYGMYDKQRKFSGKNANMENNSDIMQSSMIYGSQYDAMLNWMLKGSAETKSKLFARTNGNQNNSSAVGCGTYNSGSDVINNIYDLEGNVLELTQEANRTSLRVSRGGRYNNYVEPVFRGYGSPNGTYSSHGSRLTLYIKD